MTRHQKLVTRRLIAFFIAIAIVIFTGWVMRGMIRYYGYVNSIDFYNTSFNKWTDALHEEAHSVRIAQLSDPNPIVIWCCNHNKLVKVPVFLLCAFLFIFNAFLIIALIWQLFYDIRFSIWHRSHKGVKHPRATFRKYLDSRKEMKDLRKESRIRRREHQHLARDSK